MWMWEVLSVRVDVVAGVRVRVVCVQHRSLWGVQGTGHRGEGVRAGVPGHLIQERRTKGTLSPAASALLITSFCPNRRRLEIAMQLYTKNISSKRAVRGVCLRTW